MATILDPRPQTNGQPDPAAAVDLAALKSRQQATWASGDYAIVGSTVQIVAEDLCEAVDLRAGGRVLDVATGHGNAALAAARRWCDVVGIDYVPALLDRGRERARAEHVAVQFQHGDAERIPFADESFDVVLSTFGAMFAPDQDQVARELLRVCRSNGKIGLASWTPEGIIGQLFRTIGKYAPPPAGVKSPALWGTEARLQELFGPAATIACERKHFMFRYRSPQHWLDVFRTYYGPALKTFASLDAAGQEGLARDMIEMMQRSNRSGDDSLIVPGEYLQAVVTKR